jgi:hypothetical protein
MEQGMTIEMTEKKQPRVIKANYVLQAKVGSGPLDPKVVEKCQSVIDNNDVDFAPLAKEFLDKLAEAIASARSGNCDTQSVINNMSSPVMELKANAALFKYDLIGKLANVMLSFLESVKMIDKTVIEIVDAHHKTLSVIVLKKMKGDGGSYGVQLEQELKDACIRYLQKKKASQN